ncbi:ATP-binding protein [Streptomyces violaceus]|uniref:ATP-binding protein n=1 Tax=Streptomyces violaceus TaxID=1936 RepID=A0ABZ1P576_STRVL
MLYSPEEAPDALDDGDLRTAEQPRDVTRGFLSVAAPEAGSGAQAVLLVVPELFTNALQRAGEVTGFRLEAGGGMVTMAIDDASPLPPQPRPLDPRVPGGIGWNVVQALSADVQVKVHAAGKTVTAIVPCATGITPQPPA